MNDTAIKDLPLLLTARQVAKLFNVTPVTIHLWTKANKIPFIQLPGDRSIRFSKDAIFKIINGGVKND